MLAPCACHLLSTSLAVAPTLEWLSLALEESFFGVELLVSVFDLLV
jgi:hypothetical protein